MASSSGGRRVVALRCALGTVGAALIAGGLVGLFLRAAQLRELIIRLGAETAPDYYWRYSDYGYRTGCAAFVWLGAFFVVAARDPVRHEAVVALCAWGLIAWSAFAVLLGTWIAMPTKVWGTNAAACLMVGMLLVSLHWWVRRR